LKETAMSLKGEYLMSSLSIERCAELKQKEFVNDYLLQNKPVIVTEATSNWTLGWNLQDWASRFGEEPVQIYDDLFNLMDVDTLSSFIEKYTGNDRVYDSTIPQPYIRWYTKMKDVDFVWADEVFNKIAGLWSRPEFFPDADYLLPFSSNGSLDPTKDLFPGKGLFISGKGACTRLHCDPWVSDALLCQLYGTKKVQLFSPSASASQKLELIAQDRPVQSNPQSETGAGILPTFEDTLNPKEILLIPHGWYHSVYSLTDSVSLTWNFVHRTTGKAYLDYLMSPESEKSHDVLKFFLNPRSGIN
jgi:ribosomal protein L16 Arg81 hydroxylase